MRVVNTLLFMLGNSSLKAVNLIGFILDAENSTPIEGALVQIDKIEAFLTIDGLPSAYGSAFGAVLKPGPRVLLNVTVWGLLLDQEFVYAGDTGIVEPSGKTRRLGVDFSARLQLNDWLFADFDLNYSHACTLVRGASGRVFYPVSP